MKTIKEHLQNAVDETRVSIVARIGTVKQINQNRVKYLVFELADTSECIKGICRLPDTHQKQYRETARLFIEGILKKHQKAWHLYCHSATEAAPSEYGIRSIPSTHTKIKCLDQFRDLVETKIINKYIRAFLNNIFAIPSIWMPFVTVPASWNHHHAHESGLLLHSVEVAERCYIASLDMPSESSDILIASGFLHDIGKIRTHNDKESESIRRLITHEALALEILSPHLDVLEKNWPDGANAIRYMLTASLNKQNTGFPLIPEIEILKMADRMSAAMNVREKARYNNDTDSRIMSYKGNSGPVNRFWIFDS